MDKNVILPDNSTIKDVLERAKKDAHLMSSSLGMTVDISEANDIQIRNINVCNEDIEDIDNEEISNNEDFSENTENNNDDVLQSEQVLQDLMILSNITGTLELRDFSQDNTQIRQDSPFTVVKDSSGKEHVVRKSSICWLLNSNNSKLSNDRLQRVRTSEYEKYSASNITPVCDIHKSEKIFVEDWCLFKKIDSENCLIGLVLGFAYVDGKTWKSVEFSNNYANVIGNKKNWHFMPLV